MYNESSNGWVQWIEDDAELDKAPGCTEANAETSTNATTTSSLAPLPPPRPTFQLVPRAEWRDTGGVDASNVITGKRRRA